jgi:uncharacterized NAD(P)/FAD-binding protein YdhS
MLTAPHVGFRPTVAIIGAGASGMLLATHLLRISTVRQVPVRAVLIDRKTPSGGAAYSTNDPHHRLNVTAGRMSGFPDEHDHFVRWRAHNIGDDDPGAYAGRWEYRRYLEDILATAQQEAPAGIGLARVVSGVERLDVLATHARLRFEGGGSLEADSVVLALGNPPPQPPHGCEDARDHPAYVNDPWAPGALDRHPPPGDSPVLLIGSGLTMVDVAMTLSTRFPHARLLAVSRTGLLPRAHLPGRTTPKPNTLVLTPDASLPELVDAILTRSAIGDAQWHQLVDDVRPRTQALWKRLSTDERIDFLATRHRAWCVRRHRMPPQVATTLANLIGTGALVARSGSVELSTTISDTLEARISTNLRRTVSLAVNCTGPGLDPRANPDPLVRQILTEGHVCAHPAGVGFDTHVDGSFRTRDGTPTSRLYTLGPPRIGELYETTAIPEIREQAQALAGTLVARLTKGAVPAAQPA